MACGGLAKAFLILFNLLFLLIGLVPLIFGIISVASQSVLQTVIENIPGTSNITSIVDLQDIIKSSAIYIIILGAVIVVIGFLGFCGACCKVKWMVVLYIVVLIVLLLAEIAIIVLAVAFPSSFSSSVKTTMLKSLKDKPLNDFHFNNSQITVTSDGPSLAWHGLQYGLKCCGANNLSDYLSLTWTPRVQGALAPLTCCLHNNTDMYKASAGISNAYCVINGTSEAYYSSSGCFDALLKTIVTSPAVIGIMAGIGGLEIILLIFSCIRYKDIKKDHKKD